jgi:nucleoside transporter
MTAPDVKSPATVPLSIMMFLEYVIWGSWLPLLSLYLAETLKFSGDQAAWIFATPAVASVFALFVGGQIADRYLSGEKVLLVCHALGGALMFAMGAQSAFAPFFALMLLYQLVYVPTLSVTNSIAFHNLAGREREFGRVRLWGTIGWIAASLPFYFILKGKAGAELEAARGAIFTVAGLASFALAAFSFALPKTPPSHKSGSEANAPLKALKLLAVPAFGVLFAVTLMDAMVHQAYFQFTGLFLAKAGLPENVIMIAMSIGQAAEILTMATLAFFLRRLGWRKIMAFGILGHAARFFIFALGQPVWLMVGVNILHGFCYAFFFASVYIFVDEYFPRDSRASAQSLFNLLILGLGPFLGAFLWGKVQSVYTTAAGLDFHKLFLFPAGLAVAATVLLLLAFHPQEQPTAQPQRSAA